jgi:MFS family permease
LAFVKVFMPKVLTIAVVAGLVAGLLVGGFHNLFTVPVIERAIALEEQQAAAEAKAAGTVLAEEKPLVSLGAQRVGMAVGTAILGIVLGLVFSGGYALLRRLAPQWPPIALALAVAALGFWSLSLFPFIKWPLNPPGVGEVSTLLFRQGFQGLFFFLSALGVVAFLLGLKRINGAVSSASQRVRLYGLALLGYGIFAAIIFLALPGNPDPVEVPLDLLELFRTLTMIGQFLLWVLLALGVGLTIMWYQRASQRQAISG